MAQESLLDDFTRIKHLRSQAKAMSKQVQLKHSPADLWPYLSNTDMLNAKIRLATTQPTYTPLPQGGSQMAVTTQDMGMTLQYDELPFEWLAPSHLAVERLYRQGLLLYLCFAIHLTPKGTGTQAMVSISVVSQVPLWLTKPRLQQIVKKMAQMLQQIDQSPYINSQLPVGAYLEPADQHQKSIDSLTRQWAGLLPDSPIPQALATYIYTAPERYVAKIRPWELADLYQLDPMETLRFCLLATRQGYLNLSWDLLCTSCQGAKSRLGSLAEVSAQVHCDACVIDYGVRLDENVELTFYPVKTVRDVTLGAFCAGSPANTAHAVMQINLWPQQQITREVVLAPGHYQLKSLALKGALHFEVAPGGQTTLACPLNETLPEQQVILAPHCQWSFENLHPYRITLKIENLDWREKRVTAAKVSTLQDFRDWFGAEVLRPGVNLEITNVVFLFTDLKDSTQMYEHHGDALAFQVVHDHFEVLMAVIREHQGAIVKTMGDAVMAVFQDPLAAVHASVAIQRAFEQWNQGRPLVKQVTVKMGLHRGPCIALNLNDKLDYFGSTVNKSARIQGTSIGHDIMISDDLWHWPGVGEYLQQPGCTVTPTECQLKGISDIARLYRIAFHNLT